MLNIPVFSREARKRKEIKATLAAARVFVLSHEDLVEYREGCHASRFAELNAAWRNKNAERCAELLSELDKPKSFAFAREWLDILVVSISVAMAFRAYFYEPFNIPTGSMRPTLYGNWSEPAKPMDASVWDRTPILKQLKWLVTGETFVDFKAPCSGTLIVRPDNNGHYIVGVAAAPGQTEKIPTDAFIEGTGRLVGGKGHGDHQRGTLHNGAECGGGNDRVLLSHREQCGKVRVPLFPSLHEGEEEPQRHIEEGHRVGVGGDQQHTAKKGEHPRHGVAHQAELFIQKRAHPTPSFQWQR